MKAAGKDADEEDLDKIELECVRITDQSFFLVSRFLVHYHHFHYFVTFNIKIHWK